MGGRVEMQEFYIEVAEDSTDSSITYVGKAFVASDGDKSRPIWQILKITETGTSTSVTYADGDVKFDNIWNDRETLSY